MQHQQAAPLTLFYSYAHEDEPLREQLEKHLRLWSREGLISEWHDRKIPPGAEWAREIDAHMETASIILLLISPDFLASDYCYEIELRRALELDRQRRARVIPLILRPCNWQATPIGKLQALPPGGKPIASWADRDEAFLQVTMSIRQIIQTYPQIVLRNPLMVPKQETEPTLPSPNKWNIVGALGPLITNLINDQQWEQAEAEIRAIANRQMRASALSIFTADLTKAQQWARAEAVARSVDDSRQRATLLYGLSRELGHAHEWRRAEAVARSIRDDQARATALEELGSMLIQAGEVGRAKEVVRAAVVPELSNSYPRWQVIVEEDRGIHTQDHYFIRVRRNRWFPVADIVLNVFLSLVIVLVLPFPSNVWTAGLGVVLSVFTVRCCIFSVKKLFAMIFGTAVALWWGYAAFAIAVTFSHSLSVSVTCFFLALIIGIGSHVWFVNRKLRL